MHACPVTRCTESIGDTKLMCPPHWMTVPGEMRRNLIGAYQRLQAAAGTQGYEADAATRRYRELRLQVIELANHAVEAAQRNLQEELMKAWVFNEEMLEKALTDHATALAEAGTMLPQVPATVAETVRSFLESPAAQRHKLMMGAKP